MTDQKRARPPVAPEIPEPAGKEPAEEAINSSARYRGSQRSPTKIQVTVRLDRDIVDKLRKGGRGWQTRLNETLRSTLLPGTVKPRNQTVTIKRVIVDPED